MSEDMNGDEIPDDENALEAGLSATPSGSHPDSQPPRFDADAAQYFNRRLPLNLLKQATLSESLPNPLRRQVARAAWVRAVVLGDDATAQALAPIVASFTPEMKDDLDKYSSEQRKDNRNFMAMLTILKTPAMRPYITAGVERQGGLNEISEFRDNWWCGWSLGSGPGGDWLPRLDQSLASIHPLENSGAAVGRNAQPLVESPQFLTEAERTATDQEWERLSSVAAAPNYLTQAVLEYAKSHADDERVPEALHLAVRATRYGCTDSDTGNLSKEAFDLLHARYPHSPWTEQTKYWFSGGAE